jgi:Ca-activated chloride channel family protein
MQFEKPAYFVLLWLLPILLWVYYDFSRRQRLKLEAIGDKDLVENLFVGKKDKSNFIRTIFFLLALLFFIIGLTNPRMGKKETTVANSGVDVIIALDLSKSMMAEDIKPNRLERAKALISTVVDQFHGHRVGFVVFAGNAYLQMPLTVDYSAFNMYLENAVPSLIQNQGTDIGAAIDVSEHAFVSGDKNYKTLLLISDGETFDKEALKKAKATFKNGTRIYTIGVGEEKGGTIPEYDESNNFIDYKKDENGKEVISIINEKKLKEIAKAGGGEYFHLTAKNNTKKVIVDAIDKQEKRKYKEKLYLDYVSKYQYFIGIGLFFLVLSFFGKSLNTYFLNLFKIRKKI